jgi:hypothetical protein
MVELVYDPAEGCLGDAVVRGRTGEVDMPAHEAEHEQSDGLTLAALAKDVDTIVAEIEGYSLPDGRWEIYRLRIRESRLFPFSDARIAQDAHPIQPAHWV